MDALFNKRINPSRMKRKLIKGVASSIMIIIFISSFFSYASEFGGEKKPKESGASKETISSIISEAKHSGNARLSDSLSLEAVKEAEMTYDSKVILMAYNNYFELTGAYDQTGLLLLYAQKAEALARRESDDYECWKTWMNLASVYRANYEFDKALEFSYQAMTLSALIGSENVKAHSYLSIGRSLEAKNNKIEAFRNYLNALTIAKGSHNIELQRICYESLSRFYNFHKIYDKAVEYKLLEMDIIRMNLPLDSLALMYAYYDLESIALNSKGELNLVAIDRLIHFAERKQDETLRSSCLALLRTYLINEEKIDVLYQFYQEEHPQYLEILRNESPLTYIRLKAFFSEYKQDYDAADKYYAQAQEKMTGHPNLILQAHFFLRFGEYLARRGEADSAIAKVEKALSFSEDAGFLDYTLKAALLLEKFYKGKKAFEQALHYSERTRQVSDSIRQIAKSEDLLTFEIENAERIRQIDEQRIQIETTRRNNLQYSAIIIAIFSLFVILIMLGSFRVPKWSIQALGFFSFIFLFEFLILIADTEIHHLTHGMPWKILAIKIVLIAFLLPFHHWVEKRVVSYLIKKRLINLADFSFRNTLVNVWNTVFGHS